MSDLSHITDKRLEELIDATRPNMHSSSSEYHIYIAEKERRDKQSQLEREKEKQQIAREQYNSVASRLDKIINLLELIGKHPWWSSIIAFAFAVLAGLFANLLTDYAHYIIGLFFNK